MAVLDPWIVEAWRIVSSKEDGAKGDLESLLAEHPDDPSLVAILAMVVLRSGDCEGALRLIDTHPLKDGQASLLAARHGIASKLGAFDDAEDLFRRAYALDPDDLIVLRAQASRAFFEGDFAACIEILERTLVQLPGNPDVLKNLITTRILLEGPDEAERVLHSTPPDFEKTAQWHASKAAICSARKDFAGAERERRFAVAACPTSSSSWTALAVTLMSLAREEEAERAAQYALELDTRDATALRVLAMAAGRRGDLARQAELQNLACQASARLSGFSVFGRVGQLLRSGRRAEAADLLRDHVDDENRLVAQIAQRMIVGVLLDDGQFEQAREAFQRCQPSPGASEILLVCEARLLHHDGCSEQALSILMPLVERVTPYADAYVFAVQVLAETGNREAATALVREFEEALPGSVPQAVNLILVLERLGMMVEAQSLLTVAWRRYPSSTALIAIRRRFEGRSSPAAPSRESFWDRLKRLFTE